MSFFNKLKGDMGVEASGQKVAVKKKQKLQKLEPALKKEEFISDGELSIDLYETDGDFVIQSTIGGIKAEDLDIAVENDLVTIRGSRENKIEKEGKKYFYQECYWGSFSRQVILPEEVDGSKTEAKVKDGVLTLRLPKLQKTRKKKITARQEE